MIMYGELYRKGILYQQDQIYVLRMAMPFPLRENNAYIAETPHGWAVIDTGVNIPENQERWLAALKEIGISLRHIKQIYLTHYHHDHLGLSGWLQDKTQADVYLPEEDLYTFNTYISTDQYRQAVEKTCRHEGWDSRLIDELSRDVQSIDPLVKPYPYLTPLTEQHSFELSENRYQLLHVPGHSDGHYVFFSSQTGHLFAGDNLVNHTILHLTDWPHTRLNDPLGYHLSALQQINHLELRWVFPGHGQCFSTLAERIDLIKQHHQKRQSQVLLGLKEPSTAWNLAQQIFRDNPYIHIKRLILAETLAYLYSLVAQKLVSVEQHQGINYYQQVCQLN